MEGFWTYKAVRVRSLFSSLAAVHEPISFPL
jgi:hypothetical protein